MTDVDGGWYWGWTGGDSDTWAAWWEVCRFDELRSLIWGINR